MKTFNLDAMTKFDLLSLLFAKQAEKHEFVKYNKGEGKTTIRGIVNRVEREDGSGNCFILTISGFRQEFCVFVRTIDSQHTQRWQVPDTDRILDFETMARDMRRCAGGSIEEAKQALVDSKIGDVFLDCIRIS